MDIMCPSNAISHPMANPIAGTSYPCPCHGQYNLGLLWSNSLDWSPRSMTVTTIMTHDVDKDGNDSDSDGSNAKDKDGNVNHVDDKNNNNGGNDGNNNDC